MKKRIELAVAPTGMQPGGYVAKAYADHSAPVTPEATLEVAHPPGTWRIAIDWACGQPVRDVREDPGLFPDAAAVFVPQAKGAPWVTMGAPGLGVEGLLWRADREGLYGVRAEGLGTMKREDARDGWTAKPNWKNGRWRIDFTLRGWPALDEARQLAFAIWQGDAKERGGLKSVSPGWVEVRL